MSTTQLSPDQQQRRLRVFLCHSSDDKPAVRDLYRRLQEDDIQPWLDEKELLPGQEWQETISSAVRASDVVLVCLSRQSVSKEGYLQREIREALRVEEEKPEGTIFIVPVRMEDVQIPQRLSKWQSANLFEKDGYKLLATALRTRANELGLAVNLQSDKIYDLAEPVADTLPEVKNARGAFITIVQWVIKRRILKLVLVLSLLFIVAAVGWLANSITGFHRADFRQVEDLLSEEYTHHRTLAFRFRRAQYGPFQSFPIRLGNRFNSESLMDRVLLAEAEAQIANGLKANPSDPNWIEARAEADLLNWDYESAINGFRQGLKARPNSPELQEGLAAALFEQVDKGDHPNYSAVINILIKLVSDNPEDTTASFNLALVYEQSQAYDLAEVEFNKFLQLEPNGGWAMEARQRLNATREKIPH
jgi:TIR domain-containing protein